MTHALHHIKIYSKWIADLSVKPKFIKLLKENLRENFYDLGLNSDFLNMVPQPWFIKEQIDKLDLIKTKNFFSKGISKS